MPDLSVQLPQFFAIAFANFFLGWLWYSPVSPWFGTWVKAVGLNPDPKAMSAEDKARLPWLFGGALVSSFALSFVLQVVVRSLGAQGFGDGLGIGLLLFVGLVLPTLLGTLWEGRKAVVVAINLGNYAVVCGLFGGLLAIWR